MTSMVEPGDRIELLQMPNDPSPIEAGATGTVERVVPGLYEGVQISVKWDNGRSLMLVVPPDEFTVIERG